MSLIDLSQTKLIIFDLDGTLVEPRHPTPKGFRSHAHDWQVKDGVLPVLRHLRSEHIELAIATNQGGVAFHIFHALDMKRAVDDAAYLLGIYLVYICFDHPKGNDPRWTYESNMRKPIPGMIYRAIDDAHVNALETLMVGDRDEDREVAQNAMVRFMHAKDFFDTLNGIVTPEPLPTDFPF